MQTKIAQLLLRSIAALVVSLLLTAAAFAQSALVVHKNANLREKASTQSAVVEHLKPGDELTALSETKTNNFWHVRTSEGNEGWVYRTLVHVEEEDEEDDPVTPTSDGISDAFDPNWPKPAVPTGAAIPGPPGFDPCPARGEEGGDYATNSRKNRRDVPTSYRPISFDAFMSLPDIPGASTKRQKWTQAQKDTIAPFEGVAVSIIGYINRVKAQHNGGGESTNCHFSGDERFTDIHVALVEDYFDPEKEAIVVEPTPRFYAQHPKWVWSRLRALEHSKDPVRISGWTIFDPSHRGHMGKYRKSMWEIHPITKIEVFKDGKWTVW